MKNRNYVMAALAVTVIASSAVAQANQRCGAGTMIWGGSNGIISQTFENSTNRFLSGGGSISSATSGCKHNGNFITLEERVFDQQLLYANANYEELMLEMADGRGEVLEAFAQTLGCGREVMPEFSAMTRAKYGELVGADGGSPERMLLNVRGQIKANPRLESGCKSYII